jgi:hypothetical protein
MHLQDPTNWRNQPSSLQELLPYQGVWLRRIRQPHPPLLQ